MAFSMITNISSLVARRNLDKTTVKLSESIERLSSGLRINRASDDAAGLAIGTKLKAHIRSLNRAKLNSNDAVSMIQTAEGALTEVAGLLNRMRELSVQASTSGTLTTADRSSLNVEFQTLESEIDRITNVTQYNDRILLNGSLSSGVSFQVGIMNTTSDRVSLTLSSAYTSVIGTSSASITTATQAALAITRVDSAISKVSARRSTLGAAQNRLSTTIAVVESIYENTTTARSRMMDTDVAEETTLLARNQILLQAGASVLAQANQMPAMALTLLR